MKGRLCAVAAALAVLALSFSGCGDETGQTVPAPTASAASQADGTQAAQTGLLNAVKEGETYRYLVWNVTDPTNPYKAMTDSLAAAWHKKREAIQEKYGITIEYVKSPEGSWDATAMEAAYTGTPLADIVDLGGNYNVLRFYNYNGRPGAIMAPLSDYSQYADFNDEAYWDTQLQETCIFQDKLWYCVPRVNGVGNVSFNMVTFIDKNVMEAKGISVQELYELNQNGEWTWEKFREIAARTTDPDSGEYGVLYTTDVVMPYALMAANQVDPLGKQEQPNGTMADVYAGNDARVVETYNFLAQLFQDNQINVGGDSEFNTGKYAMTVTYMCRATNYSPDNLGIDRLGILMPPKGPAAQDYSSMVNWYVPSGVFKDISNKAGAVQIMCEYLRPEYAIGSEEDKALFEAEAMTFASDEGSLWTLNNLADKTMGYKIWNYSNAVTAPFSDMSVILSILDGSTTAQAHFDSVADSINYALKSEQGLQ